MKKSDFSIIKRAKSFTHAFRGLSIVIKTQPNFWIHIVAVIIVTLLGIVYDIRSIEWGMLVLTFGLVLVTETLNTAFEVDINLTSPTYHPYAKDTKDIAAGAVLLSTIIAIVIGLIIFVPKMF